MPDCTSAIAPARSPISQRIAPKVRVSFFFHFGDTVSRSCSGFPRCIVISSVFFFSISFFFFFFFCFLFYDPRPEQRSRRPWETHTPLDYSRLTDQLDGWIVHRWSCVRTSRVACAANVDGSPLVYELDETREFTGSLSLSLSLSSFRSKITKLPNCALRGALKRSLPIVSLVAPPTSVLESSISSDRASDSREFFLRGKI